MISGIKVGTVSSLDFAGYKADVHFKLHDNIRIPKDSAAAAVSGGVLDPGMALGIRPGKSTEMLAPGAELKPQ